MNRFWVLFFIIVVALGSALWHIYNSSAQAERKLVEEREISHINQQVQTIIADFRHIISDLLILSGQHEMKAMYDDADHFPQPHLVNDYLLLSKRKGLYDQIRYIDEHGMEVVRVNYNDDAPAPVPDSELQNKSDRYYFKEAIKLDKGEIYISPFDLNIENMELEMPIKPMIRFATPVFDTNGSKKGIIVLNYLGEGLLNNMKVSAAAANGKIMLINPEGYWLVGLEEDDEWGFMFEDKKDRAMQSRFPEVWKKVAANDSGQLVDGAGLFTFATIYPRLEGLEEAPGAENRVSELADGPAPAPKYFWKVVSFIPSDMMLKESKWLFGKLLALFTALAGIIGTVMYIGTMGAPQPAKITSATGEDITEQAISAILGAVGVGVVVINEESTIKYANSELARIFGYELKELINKPVTMLMPEKYRQRHNNGIKKYLDTGLFKILGRRIELEGLHKNGATFHIELRIEETILEDNHRLFTAAIRDTTTRKLAEEALSKVVSRYKATLDATSDGILVYDNEQRIIDYNSRFQEIWHIPDAILKKKSRYEAQRFVQDQLEDPDNFLEGIQNMDARINSDSFDILRFKDGTILERYSQPQFISGKNVGRVVLFRDVTKRKRAESSLIASEALYRNLVETSTEGICHLDMDGNYLYMNPGGLSLCGYDSLDEVVGMNCLAIIKDEYKPTVKKALERAKKGSLALIEYISYSKNGGEIIWESYFSPIKNEYGEVTSIHKISHDITKRKQTDADLRWAKEKIEQTIKEKDDYMTLIAHDLKTPFTSIIGLLNLAITDKETPLTEEYKERFRSILDQSEQAVNMIDEILQSNRFRTGKLELKPKFFDGYAMVIEAIARFSHLATEKGVTVTNSVPEETRIYADPVLYRKVIQNLISNAIKFCHQNGTVTLFVAPDEPSTIAVKDDGVGVDPNIVNEIFRHDVKTTRPGTTGEKGTGLGLPLCYDIIQAHNGTLSVESSDGAGSVFYIKLPHLKPLAMVVNNDVDDRQFLRKLLGREDISIVEADSLAKILDITRSSNVNIIICDRDTTGLNKAELLRCLRDVASSDNVPVVFISENGAQKSSDGWQGSVAVEHINKPLTEEKLLESMWKLLG